MQTFDAIVVGSGACGGWAAMELTAAGLKVLMLEAGGAITPAQDFHHRFLYQLDYRGQGKPGLLRQYAGSERNYRIMIDNTENPYTTSPETVYRWGRSRCLGGRTLHWARATDRMADYEFKAASRDGYGMDWAVSYADMKPYYDRVEGFIGVSAAARGICRSFQTASFLPPMPLNCAETIFTAACKTLGWPSTHRRLAQLTRPHNGRPPCHYCGNCVNGCDVGAMFNPIAVTLPPALKTGNLEVRTDSVVARVRMNAENRAQGVTYIERFTMKSVDVDATARDPRRLHAREHAAPAALGEGRARELERHARPVHDRPGGRRRRQRHPAEAQRRTQPPRRRQDGRHHDPELSELRRQDPAQGLHPRLRDERDRRPDRISGSSRPAFPGYGSAWKKEIKSRYVAQARIWNAGAEMLARKDNFVELDPEVKDHWGIPVLRIHFTHSDNDYKLIEDFQQRAEELFRKAGGEIMPGPAHTGRVPRWRGLTGCRAAASDRPRHDGSSAAQTQAPRRLDPRGGDGADERQPQGRRARPPSARRTMSRTCMCSGATPSRPRATSTRRLTMMALAARGCDHLLETARGRKA